MKVGAHEGVVLKHPLDQSMGSVYKFVPELNLRDISNPGSDLLLDLLKHRATNTLLDQLTTGPNGGSGDYADIKQSMDTQNLRLLNPIKNSFTVFLDEDAYGQSYKIKRAELAPALMAKFRISEELGELILMR